MQEGKAQCFGKQRSVVPDGAALIRPTVFVGPVNAAPPGSSASAVLRQISLIQAVGHVERAGLHAGGDPQTVPGVDGDNREVQL